MIRKQYSAAFKARVVQELLKEEKTLAQLAAEYEVHPTQLKNWRAVALEGMASLFEKQDSAGELVKQRERRHPMTSQAFVDLGERRLSLMTAGQGTPLVILEAGAGNASTTWQGIFHAVAHFTQVLAYDRAGLGQSDATPQPRTTWQLTDDLAKLLCLAQYVGPYVLVGHSLGALLCRLYAQRYPQEVAGLVLIDGPHPEQGNRFARALMATGYHQHSLVQPILEMAAGGPPEAHPEGLDFARSLAQIDPAHRFGALPLVVIASGKSHAQEMPELPQQAALAFDQAWDDMQRDLATLSTRGSHLTAMRSGHYIHWDEPDLVVQAIQQVVADIQNRSQEK